MRVGIRNVFGIQQRQLSTNSFIIREKERFVLLEWTAYGSAKLIPMKVGFFGGEEVPGVHCAVPEISIGRAMKIVGPAARDFVDDGSSVEFRAKGTRQRGEFRDTLHSERSTGNVESCLRSPEPADFQTILQNRACVH